MFSYIWAAMWEIQIFAYAKFGFLHMRKTKTQISFAVTVKLISVFVFATQIVQSLFFPNLKFQVSSHLQWLPSPVCVTPGQKPRRPVFSERGSFVIFLFQSMPRIRIGIDRPASRSQVAEYVLTDFPDEEQELIDKAVNQSLEKIADHLGKRTGEDVRSLLQLEMDEAKEKEKTRWYTFMHRKWASPWQNKQTGLCT